MKQRIHYWKGFDLIFEKILDEEEVNKLHFEHQSWKIKKNLLGNVISANWTPPTQRLTVENILGSEEIGT